MAAARSLSHDLAGRHTQVLACTSHLPSVPGFSFSPLWSSCEYQSAWLPLFLRCLLCFLLLSLSVYLCCLYCFVRSTLTVRGHIHTTWGITTELGDSGNSFANLRPISVPTQVDRSYGNRTPLVRPSGWAYDSLIGANPVLAKPTTESI